MKVDQMWHSLQHKLTIKNGAEAVAAASFSVVLSALATFIACRGIYGSWPSYTEFVAGGTVYSGYNKQGDLLLFYLLLIGIPLFFAAFLWCKHIFFKNRVQASKLLKHDCLYNLIDYIAVTVLGCFAIIAVETAAGGRLVLYRSKLASLRNIVVILYIVCMVVAVIYAVCRKKKITPLMQWITDIAQLLLPFCFLGYFSFYYQYENEDGLIALFASGRWKWMCIGLFVCLFLVQVYRLLKKKKGISISSLAIIATMLAIRTPGGIMSVDFFHNGEMALPMQQMMSYHKLPYFDIDPIHGLCDFVYSFFNYLFFDGTYLSQNAGIAVAGIFMAAFLAVVLACCLKNRQAALLLICLFMPYLTEKAGVRYVLFLAAFLILLNDKVRKNDLWFLWWWVLLCIIAIAYNVSIGASMAVAFLPEVLWRLIKDIRYKKNPLKEMDRKQKRKLLVSWIVLCVIGICFIPWFLQILRFLHENAGTTLWVNGTAIFGSEFNVIATFAVFIPYLCILALALSHNRKAGSAFLSMVCGLFVIANYTCVRYDEALRLAVVAVLFCLIFIAYFYKDFLSTWNGILALCALLFVSGYLVREYLPLRTEPLLAVEKVPAVKEVEMNEETVEDPVVYVTGESVNMPNLGNGFVQGLTLNSLKNIQYVLESEGAEDSYLDLTNKISHTVIFDLEDDYPYTSAYNISNDLMQEKAIELLSDNPSRLILLAPYIRFDEAPVSLRSPKLYRKLLQMGYEPYIYEDVVYLLQGGSQCEQAEDGKRKLGMLNHRTELGMLPYLWGTALVDEQQGLSEVDCADGRISGTEVDFVDLEVDASKLTGDTFTVSFQSGVDGENYSFVISTGKEKLEENNNDDDNDNDNDSVHYLIPVFSSPFFYYSNQVELQIDGVEPDKIYYYRYK